MPRSLASSVLAGNRLALARLLSEVENGTADGRQALSELFSRTGKAHLIGVTGSPGTGKSSLVNRLAQDYRRQGERQVAIIAVDPSSPFTGGALLGDRVRMRDLSGDAGIFIRSMASRGSLGGLAGATASAAHIFDAAGYGIVLIETVGAGQGEVDIARLAHTTLVVEAPGLGDDIQAIKAGIVEIADVFVVNKADRPGVENTERALRSMLELGHPAQRVYSHHGTTMVAAADPAAESALWMPPIQRTVATDGTGVAELLTHIAAHARFLRESGTWSLRERSRLQGELDGLVQQDLVKRFRGTVPEARYTGILDQVCAHTLSPWEAAQLLVNGQKP